jgi:hypothetical protein
MNHSVPSFIQSSVCRPHEIVNVLISSWFFGSTPATALPTHYWDVQEIARIEVLERIPKRCY